MQSNEDRTPPTRIRLTGLQEDQLNALVEIDAACAAMYYAASFDAAEVPVRVAADFVRLARSNNVRVVEADNEVAGLLAWHDESPGVAYLADIQVHPDRQRFGLATTLLEAVREEARGHRFEQVVVRCWEKATWAMGFYRRRSASCCDRRDHARAAKVQRLEGRAPGLRGDPLTRGPARSRSGHRKSAPAPKIMTDDEMDMTLLTGELPDHD